MNWGPILVGCVVVSAAMAQSPWVIRETGTSANLWGATFLRNPIPTPLLPDQIVAVGEQGTILTSADGGISWTRRQSGTSVWLTAVRYDSVLRRVFAVGDAGVILSSADGITWAREISPTTIRLNAFGSGWNGGTLYVVGEPGAGLLIRDQTGVWTQREVGFGQRWMRGMELPLAVGQDGGTFTQPGDDAQIAAGAQWQMLPLPSSADLEAIARGPLPIAIPASPNTSLVAVGADGTILQQAFSGWVTRPSGTKQRLRGICWKNSASVTLVTLILRIPIGEYFAVGTGGTILRSKDGVAWQLDAAPTERNLNSVAVADNTVIAVGDGGTILQTGGSQFAPSITRPPTTGTNADGVNYAEVEASGSGALTYLWVEIAGGAPYPVGTDSPRQSLAKVPFPGVDATFQLYVGNAFGLARSTTFTPNRFANLSSRAVVGPGDRLVIGGFALRGRAELSLPHTLLIRAVGPSLSSFGVANALQTPRLSVFAGSQLIAENTGWESSANAAAISAAARTVGAFPLSGGSADSALLLNLPPGNYTAQVTSASDLAGVALVEVYDTEAPGLSRLKNLSARVQVQSDEGTLISGLVIDGGVSKSVLLRAAGPALAAFGLPGFLARPRLTLFKGSTPVATATDWDSSANAGDIRAAAATVNAFAFPNGSADAALMLSLDPGAYTLQVTGADGGSGVALVEVYEMP